MEQDLIIHVHHIARTRMKECRVDGLPRGTTMEGAMLGRNLMTYIPINKTALERSTNLMQWIDSWDI